MNFFQTSCMQLNAIEISKKSIYAYLEEKT